MKYDYMFVGAGLFSATVANELKKQGKKCLIVEKRNHIAGNIYTEKNEEINIHKYGAHIFHTDNKVVWEYVNQFAEFNRYTNCPIVNYKGRIFNLPFNMNTFSKIWDDVVTPAEAEKKIKEQSSVMEGKIPTNLEEQAIKLVGKDIYELLIKGYTEKQWGKKCCDLPPDIIKRLPVRLTYDNNYFNDAFQGIPIGGYTQIIEKMLSGCDVLLNTDFFNDRDYFMNISNNIIYTGTIDRFFDYSEGALEYRSLYFETQRLPIGNFQGNAVVNYTDATIPYTRIIEHKHFEFGKGDYTYITKEYPKTWTMGDEPYYPINNAQNSLLYGKYKQIADNQHKVLFGGRLGLYKYLDMDDTIELALQMAKDL